MHFRSKVDTWLLTTLLVGATVMVATVVGLTLFGGAPPLLLLLLSAPALSLDRLEVQHASGRVVVSPRDQAGFVKAIRDRVPGVAVEGFGPDGARLDRPVNLWWVTLIPVCVLAIVGFILLTPRAPLDVTLTPSVLRVDDLSVPFDRISAVSLEESLPAVRKSRDFNSPTTLRGRFTHSQLGTGEVFVRLESPPYILARTTDGFLLFNMDDPERTRAVYEQLRARLSSRSEGLRVGGSEGRKVGSDQVAGTREDSPQNP